MTAPRMRAGTADRQAAVDGLTRHFTEGRLDPTEFDERVGTAYAATYLDELPELFADLPEAAPHRGNGSGARWPDPDRSVPVPVGSGGGPGPWSGPPGPGMHRPQRILAALAVLALVFLIGVITHGLFLFPLIWVAFFLMSSGGGGHRRGRVDPTRNTNRW
jgi:hypothetical protein